MKLTLEQMKANRKLWVEALRSGEYRQGKRKLKTKDRYCCMGVLTLLAGIVAPSKETHPPTEAINWVGLSDYSGHYKGPASDHWPCLIDMNDSGMSFAEIADIIESEPPGLFINEEPA